MNTFQFYRNSCRKEGRLKIHDLSKHLKSLKRSRERKQTKGNNKEEKVMKQRESTKLQVSALVRLIQMRVTQITTSRVNKDITRNLSDVKTAVRSYYEQLYNNTFKNSDDMDKF